MTDRSKFDRPEDGPEEPMRLRLLDEPEAIRTTRPAGTGVFTSGWGSFRSSEDMSRLAGRLDGWARWVERELEVDRRFAGLIWLRL